ncbi:hypothetical protein PHYBLDRAFT_139474 [Phycomyces blakesleeanus NRRL 1555(-)]|uniref:Uncharacterized protein n=1 Tax=Phycomyces blakesleeanus (strain ATCC 8743b / DSM 1359 / FGSC 10004 / NBRC 33097 / NRRL 1555) TaxID=763407 RepID=A0A162YAX6_PHYB8|nr:hypothetical protein PHYBLDRAFT_139474 [Phycomyces blakesleeanus NRRL 1555(-)]OAD79445.1 hypothetical protein PHYBLDRAFT_139474 [Phycomyces blakesleeanus NRRL 1555(-)]|eukprot:XP_018297485.1 hypothetical protein PHYBLDRAFT_139474 [Phycomyces blakesleeanus NRRL 1555(-)]
MKEMNKLQSEKSDVVKETLEIVSHNEVHFKDKSNEYGMNYVFELNDSAEEIETPARIRDLPLSESDAVFSIEGNKYAASNDLDNRENESDNDMSDDEVRLRIGFDPPFYCAVILISIVNKILKLFNDSFCLPLSISGLKQLSGLSTLTKGIKKYTACGECHTIYSNDESVPVYYTSPVFGSNLLCKTPLFKSGSESTIPKKAYIYHSIVSALKMFFFVALALKVLSTLGIVVQK